MSPHSHLINSKWLSKNYLPCEHLAPWPDAVIQLYCTAGEKAELTVTHNLGQYILHVADNSTPVIQQNETVNVIAANATHLAFAPQPANSTINAPVVFTIKAEDQFGNVDGNFAGDASRASTIESSR